MPNKSGFYAIIFLGMVSIFVAFAIYHGHQAETAGLTAEEYLEQKRRN